MPSYLILMPSYLILTAGFRPLTGFETLLGVQDAAQRNAGLLAVSP
ncbi:hypothetical protein Barb4_00782 [Bacteroidales bacterium Barb4]|nr:hypothetical protein Barb4_00782 [Bacteroidales bacterium Barb4]